MCLKHPRVWFLGWEDPLEKEIATHSSIPWRRRWHPTPVLLPGKSHGWRSLVGCSSRGLKESDMTERLHFNFSLSCIGEGNGNPLQCSCLENPRDRRACWAAIYGVARSRTRLNQLSSNLAASIPAWQIPWTEEPGGLQSMGSQRVRHNLWMKQQRKKPSQEVEELGLKARFVSFLNCYISPKFNSLTYLVPHSALTQRVLDFTFSSFHELGKGSVTKFYCLLSIHHVQ